MVDPIPYSPIQLTLALLDEDRKVIEEKNVQSFHRWFITLCARLCDQNAASNSFPATDIAGVALQNGVGASIGGMFTFIGSTATNGGIFVGSSNAAINKTHHALQSEIAHGTGVGQLSRALMSAGNGIYTATAGGATFDMERAFTNGTAADVQIEEVAWYARVQAHTGASHYCMMDRSLFSKTVTPAETVTFRYRIATT